MKRRSIVALLLSAVILMQGCGVTEVKTPDTKTEEATEEFDPDSIRPQDDFNGYVNAKALMEADLEENGGSTGSFQQVSEKVKEQIDTMIEDIAAGDRDSYKAGSNEQLIYDAYYQLLDASCGGTFMNDEDVAAMLAVTDTIMNTKSIDEFLELSGDLYREWGVNPIFGATIASDMKNSSVGSIMLRPYTNPAGISLKEISIGGRNAEITAMRFRTTLVDLGLDGEEAKARSSEAARMNMTIALGTDLELLERLSKDMSAYTQTALYRTNEEIDTLCPNVGAEGILKTMGVSKDKVPGMYLWDEGQLSTMDSLLTDEHLKEWQTTAVFCFMKTINDMLPEEYGGLPILYSNDMFAKDGLKTYLARELGEEYVKRYYDEEAVAEVTAITEAIVNEYMVMIDDCDWLSTQGKTAIKAKLDNMMYFIGADEPHEIKASDAKLIGHSVYDTIHNLNIRDYEKRMEMLSEGIERNGFENMPPIMVNACYSPEQNSINITAAIMNEPFYSHDQSYWENLGGIGAVVGHEISHAFDNYGMMYDMNGNYDPEWIPEEDREAFDRMAEKISDYYSHQTVLDIHPVDGQQTLGENLADISGVDCILRLTKNNEQRKELFENYARIWACVTPKDDAIGQLYMDEHSPGIIRVNAVVALFDPFYEIYGVKEGDAMYVAPEDRVTRW